MAADHLRFHVRLLDVEPPIWRRFTIRSTATFLDLHDAIQVACGWEDAHLFAFRASQRGPTVAGIPDDDFGPPTPDAATVPLAEHFQGDQVTCFYEYDFGDDWWHEVTMEERIERPGRAKRELLDGARSFPPEDCGGTHGYEDCVAASRGEAPQHSDPELASWLGDWDPERFDLAEAKARFDR